jgi:hypothetical protein
MSDIRDLLRIYGVDGPEREHIEQLAMMARVKPWWRDYSEVFQNEFPGFENDATRIRVFMPLVLPGLLQTRDYLEAVLLPSLRSPAWQRKAIEARLQRQEILDRVDGTAPQLVAVITEASLTYRWGTTQDRRDQILHLVELSERPNIELRIQRFIDGPATGMHSMVNIFDFADGEPSVVYLETDTMIEEVSKAEDVLTYIEGFNRVHDGALEPANTTIYLKHLAEQLELT